jgi:hypothetical protein
VRLISSDPFAADDVRYFTVSIHEPPSILIVSDSHEEAIFLETALSPHKLAAHNKSRFRTKFLLSSNLQETEFEGFDVVCLVNVRRPQDSTWTALNRYVSGGGGLAVFLGMGYERVSPVSVAYSLPAAQSLLPARLLADLKFEPPEALDLVNLGHPLLKRLEESGATTLLTAADVHRYWRVEPYDGASVIAPFTDERQSPAVLERVVGKGRVMMTCTAIDLGGWNAIVREGRWAFMALADQMMYYLAGRFEHQYNYVAGELPVVPFERDEKPRELLLLKPGLQQKQFEVSPDAVALTVDEADQVGHYKIRSGRDSPHFESGFSVNFSPRESDFTRMTADELDNLFGKDRYSIARDMETLSSNVAISRVGREVFPLVLFFVILAFCMEHVVANHFYETETAEAGSGTSANP